MVKVRKCLVFVRKFLRADHKDPKNDRKCKYETKVYLSNDQKCKKVSL